MDTVEIKPLAWLHPYAGNPRKNDNAVDAVARSIREFGFLVPIVARPGGEILAGHTRYKAAIKLGLAEVPVLTAESLDDAKARAFRLADNKVAELAEWDLDALRAELADLDVDIDMSAFGFDLGELEGGVGGAAPGATLEQDNDGGIEFRHQYAVIVPCESEDEQKSVYDKLVAMGYECRVVCN